MFVNKRTVKEVLEQDHGCSDFVEYYSKNLPISNAEHDVGFPVKPKVEHGNKCLVEDCAGEYVTKVISTIKLRNNKEVNVVENLCNKCGDDMDARLVKFIRENL